MAEYHYYEKESINSLLRKHSIITAKTERFILIFIVGLMGITFLAIILFWLYWQFKLGIFSRPPYLDLYMRGINANLIALFFRELIILLIGVSVGLFYKITTFLTNHIVFNAILPEWESQAYLSLSISINSNATKRSRLIGILMCVAVVILGIYYIIIEKKDADYLHILEWFIPITGFFIGFIFLSSRMLKARKMVGDNQLNYRKVFSYPYFLNNGFGLIQISIFFFIFIPYVILPVGDYLFISTFSYCEKYLENSKADTAELKRKKQYHIDEFYKISFDISEAFSPIIKSHPFQEATTIVNKLNLREKPENGKIETQVSPSDKLILVDSIGDWKKVYFNKRLLWAYSKYLKVIQNSSNLASIRTIFIFKKIFICLFIIVVLSIGVPLFLVKSGPSFSGLFLTSFLGSALSTGGSYLIIETFKIKNPIWLTSILVSTVVSMIVTSLYATPRWRKEPTETHPFIGNEFN